MAEEAKYTSEFQQENQSEQENLLLYEPPMLRKHGKVSYTTQAIFFANDFDGFPGFSDFEGVASQKKTF